MLPGGRGGDETIPGSIRAVNRQLWAEIQALQLLPNLTTWLVGTLLGLKREKAALQGRECPSLEGCKQEAQKRAMA